MGPSEPKGLGFCGHASDEELPIYLFIYLFIFMAKNDQGVSCSFGFVCFFFFLI